MKAVCTYNRHTKSDRRAVSLYFMNGKDVQKHSECTVTVPAFCILLELGWDGVAWVIDLVEDEN